MITALTLRLTCLFASADTNEKARSMPGLACIALPLAGNTSLRFCLHLGGVFHLIRAVTLGITQGQQLFLIVFHGLSSLVMTTL